MQRWKIVWLALLAPWLGGCLSSSGPEVVVYCALDAEFAEPIVQQYERDAGVTVRMKTDVEANKTVGLVESIIAESAQPRCDVFWNNEIMHTLRLEKRGLLSVYRPPATDGFPEQFRSPQDLWHGFAARGRVLLVNRDLVPEAETPRSLQAFLEPKWRGKCGLAKPLFGTTATHAACLFATWGDERAKEFFRGMKANGVRILPGNKQVAQAVSSGELAFGLTDTDDAIIEVESKRPVAMVCPDQGPGELGMLFIPNTLAIIKGAPHEAEARKFVAAMLSPATEQKLAGGPSAQIPLHRDAQRSERLFPGEQIRPMAVDFSAAADRWDVAANFLREEFTSGE